MLQTDDYSATNLQYTALVFIVRLEALFNFAFALVSLLALLSALYLTRRAP